MPTGLKSVRRFEQQHRQWLSGYEILSAYFKKGTVTAYCTAGASEGHNMACQQKDLWQNEHYEKCMDVFSGYLKNTNMPSAPWYIIDAKSRKWTEVQILETLTQGIEIALSNHQMAVPLLQNVFPVEKNAASL